MFYRSHVLVEMTSTFLVREQLKLKRDWRELKVLGLDKEIQCLKPEFWGSPFLLWWFTLIPFMLRLL